MRPLSVIEPGRPFSGPERLREGGGVFRLNPCEIKIDLFCKGMVVESPCDLGRGACALNQGVNTFLAISVPVTSVTDAEYTED